MELWAQKIINSRLTAGKSVGRLEFEDDYSILNSRSQEEAIAIDLEFTKFDAEKQTYENSALNQEYTKYIDTAAKRLLAKLDLI